MVLSAYAQKSTSIKAFEYPDYLCPNPYTGKPIYGGNTLAISYSEKKKPFCEYLNLVKKLINLITFVPITK